MDSITRRKFSKLMSFVLRHRPEEFGLTLDEEGFVPVEDFLQAVRRRREWQNVGEAELQDVAERSERRRFQIRDGKVRATYGHTLPNAPVYPAVEPPEALFHGTARPAIERIRENGLEAMDRQYVHLSATGELARETGLRHDESPVVLRIRTAEAAAEGIVFHHPIEEIYLVKEIPARFIDFPEENE